MFLMLFSPFAFVGLKMVILSILIFSLLLKMLIFTEKIEISKSVLFWFVIFIGHGLFFLLIGLINNVDISYSLKFSTIAIVWPLCFGFLFFYNPKKNSITSFFNIVVISSVFISIYTIYKVLSLLGYLPIFDIYPDDAGLGLDISDGHVELAIPAATSLMFIAPAIISQYLLTKNKVLLPCILMTAIAVVLIARRALLLNMIISPIICVIIAFFFLGRMYFSRLLKKVVLYYILAIIVAIITFFVLANIGVFDVKEYYTMLLEGFDFSGKQSVDPGAMIRADQFNKLIESWSEKPFFGWGYGAVSPTITRSDVTPFIYELSYIALLFQTGIFGFLIYFGLIGWIYYKLFRLRRFSDILMNNYIISYLVGLTTFLFANATNPYLYAFDHMWVLFLPLLAINSIILNKPNFSHEPK